MIDQVHTQKACTLNLNNLIAAALLFVVLFKFYEPDRKPRLAMLCIYYCCQQMPLNNGDLASSLPALMSVMMNEEQPGHIV